MSQDPHTPEELARLLQAGRRAVLSPESLDRIRSATLAQGAGQPPGAPGDWPGPPRSSLTAGRLWGLGGAGAGVGVAVTLLVLSRSAYSPLPPPGLAGSVEPARSAEATTSPPEASAPPSGALDPAETAPLVEPGASSAVRPARPAASGVRRPERGPNARGDREDPREGLLLLQARRALPADPARALQLTGQHSREFPSSQLAYERQQIEREARQLLAR